MSFNSTSLNLFKILSNQKIKHVLKKFSIEAYDNIQFSQCLNSTGSHVKRTLILSNKPSYGLQDILIKDVKIQHLTDPRNCKTQDHKLKCQHIMKFAAKVIFLMNRNY